MITLSILIVIALICALVGCLMGLFSLVGLLASLVIGVLVGAASGWTISCSKRADLPELSAFCICSPVWESFFVFSS